MKTEVSPSHVAVLVPSVRKAADYLRQLKFEIGEEETFEETREIYVQGNLRNSLLLMEAKDTGSYRRAFEKRGPGIHHLAIDVLDLEEFFGLTRRVRLAFASQQHKDHQKLSNRLSSKA